MAQGFPVEPDRIAEPMMKTIECCRKLHEKQLQGKTAFPFLTNLASGQFFDPEAAAKGMLCYKGFRYDLARLLRYQTAIEYIVENYHYPPTHCLNLLEIGPGYIDTIKALSQLQAFYIVRIDAIDIDATNLRKGFEESPELRAVRFEAWEYDMAGSLVREWAEERAGTYDVVTMFETIEHFEPDQVPGILRMIRSLMRDNGIFLVSSPRAEIEPASMWPGHKKHYTSQEMLDLFTSAGFRVDRSWGNRSIGGIEPQDISQVIEAEARVYHAGSCAILVWALIAEAPE